MRCIIASDTWSRGNSSSTNRSPSASRMSAPWPRNASDSKRPGHRRVVQGGGMELHELEVGHRRPRSQRHGDAVAGGLWRVGGDRVELAGSAGGDSTCAARTSCAAVARRRRRRHGSAALDDQVDREGVLVQGRRGGPHRLDERSLDLDTGGGPPACRIRGSEWPPSRASR
jgi:hypothetical protein